MKVNKKVEKIQLAKKIVLAERTKGSGSGSAAASKTQRYQDNDAILSSLYRGSFGGFFVMFDVLLL